MFFTREVSQLIENELAQYFQFLEIFHSKIPITENILSCIFWKTIVPKVKQVSTRIDVSTSIDKNNERKFQIPKK